MKFFVLILLTSFLLTACQTRPDVVQELACGSRDYMPLIGHHAAAVTLPSDANIRILSPDQPVTEDYVYDRINLVTDRKGIIREIACG